MRPPCVLLCVPLRFNEIVSAFFVPFPCAFPMHYLRSAMRPPYILLCVSLCSTMRFSMHSLFRFLLCSSCILCTCSHVFTFPAPYSAMRFPLRSNDSSTLIQTLTPTHQVRAPMGSFLRSLYICHCFTLAFACRLHHSSMYVPPVKPKYPKTYLTLKHVSCHA